MNVLADESVDGVRNESRNSGEYEYDYEEEEYGEKEQEYRESDEGDQGGLDPIDITEETLKQIERELCLIRLCWPPLELGNFILAQLPNSYRTTSDKEKLLLWYAENFRKQYHTIYGDRKPLLMACDNECGAQKFVSTSIRPSTLPYSELYTWQGCANFVSDHLEYEPPVRPLAMLREVLNHGISNELLLCCGEGYVEQMADDRDEKISGATAAETRSLNDPENLNSTVREAINELSYVSRGRPSRGTVTPTVLRGNNKSIGGK